MSYESAIDIDKSIRGKDGSFPVAWRKKFTFRTPDLDNLTAELLLPGSDDRISFLNLPAYAFLLSINFTLAKPYASRDDFTFPSNYTPIRREWVFKAPVVAATAWKGALKAALWRLEYNGENPIVRRLFGESLGDDEGIAGRLQFYTTPFVNKATVANEMLNPHDRALGSGTVPVEFEAVAAGVEGKLRVLYASPTPVATPAHRELVADDLGALLAGVEAMLTCYGVGAKTTLGYGTADKAVYDSSLVIRADITDIAAGAKRASTAEPHVDLPRYLESPDTLHPDFRDENGGLVSEKEYRKRVGATKKYPKKRKQEYEKAAKWWAREQEKRSAPPEPEPIAPEATPGRAVSVFPFHDFDDLRTVKDHVTTELRGLAP